MKLIIALNAMIDFPKCPINDQPEFLLADWNLIPQMGQFDGLIPAFKKLVHFLFYVEPRYRYVSPRGRCMTTAITCYRFLRLL